MRIRVYLPGKSLMQIEVGAGQLISINNGSSAVVGDEILFIKVFTEFVNTEFWKTCA